MRDTGEGAERLRDRVVVDTGRTRCSRRGRRVFAIVGAGDARFGGQRVVARELDRPRDPEAARRNLRAGALEDAQLRVAVRLEGAVTVEMVRLEVEQHRDVAGERLDVLELEARELADD